MANRAAQDRSRTVAELMTQNVERIAPEATLKEARGKASRDALAAPVARIAEHHELRRGPVDEVRRRPIRSLDGLLFAFAADFQRRGGESPMAVAPQQQASPGIKARAGRFQRRKVLAEKYVLIPIPVEVGRDNAKRGRKLGRRRQQNRFEMIAAIEKDGRSQPGRFERLG